MGYGGWSLFFAPQVVSGFIDLASKWPPDLDAMGRYESSLKFLDEACAYRPCERLFPD
jgi:hypothetical protein